MLTSRRKCGLGIAGVLASLLVGGGVKAAMTGNVYASVAPNADGSPSWAAYDSNAMTALQNGASTGGDPTQPSYYSQVADGADLPEMRDQFLTLQVPQRVLQLHQLNEHIVLRIQSRRRLRTLEVERQPFLNAHLGQCRCALRQIHK